MNYRKKPEHNSLNYLKAILESLIEYNSVSRLDIANLLYDGYKFALKDPKKKYSSKTIILELLSKWIQVLEDLAVLCMMFTNSTSNREAYEIYTKNSNREILNFLNTAKKGLPKSVISKIYCLKSANEYYKAGKINKSEIAYFKHFLNVELIGYQKNINSVAKVYSGKKNKKGKLNYGFIVDIYFKTKHNFKVIQPTDTSNKLWTFNQYDIALIGDVISTK